MMCRYTLRQHWACWATLRARSRTFACGSYLYCLALCYPLPQIDELIREADKDGDGQIGELRRACDDISDPRSVRSDSARDT